MTLCVISFLVKNISCFYLIPAVDVYLKVHFFCIVTPMLVIRDCKNVSCL